MGRSQLFIIHILLYFSLHYIQNGDHQILIPSITSTTATTANTSDDQEDGKEGDAHNGVKVGDWQGRQERQMLDNSLLLFHQL